MTRDRTNEQIGREYSALKKILNERSSKQGQRNDIQSTSNNQLSEVPPTVKAAKQLDVSQPTAMKAETVVETIDTLESQGKDLEANQLRSTLNQSVKRAYQTVQKQYPKAETVKPVDPKP